MDPVLAIVGPTGSGKSDLGLCVAAAFQGEIISCDSVQVYQGLNIGSAKVPVEKRLGIRHHLLDVITPDEDMTAGAYARQAREALRQITCRGCLPVIVGGTGLYLRAFLEGLSPAPERDEQLRTRLRNKADRTPRLLLRFLRRYDPAAAMRIHSNDKQKLIRAVELTIRGRQPATSIQGLQRDALSGVNILRIGLNPDRKALFAALNARAALMFSEGLLDETRQLLFSGVSTTAKPLQTLGYKQALAFLDGSLTEAQVIEQCQIRTRQYAKRQLTWFRHEPGVQWLNGFGSDPQVQQQALALVRNHLGIF